MDELIIDDKKYVSSKRAAKMTGYAKDYIGQLCREGRVTARLVGRSWYVLEAAIHEHRFGEKTEEKADPSSAVFSSTWKEPKYESQSVEESLPMAEKEPEQEENMAQRLQDSWKAWFERVGEPIAVENEPTEEASVEEKPLQEAVNVPIRTIHNEYQPLPHEILSRKTGIGPQEEREEAAIIEEYEVRRPQGRIVLQLTGVLLALVMVGLAAFGSGYFDRYILAHEGLGSLAGVFFYNR